MSLADLGRASCATSRDRNVLTPCPLMTFPQRRAGDAPFERPALLAVLAWWLGPFVGRGRELEQLFSTWQTTLTDGMRAC